MAKRSGPKAEIPLWAKTGHGRPVSRREFFASGIIPFAAGLILPQWLPLLLSPAEAADGSSLVCNEGEAGLPAVMVLNLSGGAALGGNYIPLKADGSLLSSYSKLGMGLSPKITREFNNVAFHESSTLVAGLRAKAAASTRDKTAFVGMCAKTRDDSKENTFAMEGLIYKAGRVGRVLPYMTRGGYYHQFAVIGAPAALAVNQVGDITGSLGYAAALKTQLKASQKEKLAKLIQGLSSTQARRLAAASGGDQIHDLIECAGIKNSNLNSGTPSGVSLNEESALTQSIRAAWEIAVNQNNESSILANVTYNVLAGNAGAGTITLGGYDYHDQTRTTGDGKDQQAGELIGRILQTAALMNKPVMIFVTTDGSVVSAESTEAGSPWTSDRGDASCSYLLAYSPEGRPALGGSQINGFTDGQAADATHIVGNNPSKAAVAAFANYLGFAGKKNLLETVAPGQLTTAQMADVIKFNG